MLKALAIRPAASDSLLARMRAEMDELFGDLAMPAVGNGAPGWLPRIDVEETDKAFVVRADVPGVDVKDLDIGVHDGTLVLRGEKKEEREEKGKNFHRVERFQGSFHREIPLPRGIDQAGIAATCAKGVVTVTVPKKPEGAAKKIAVQSKD